MKLSSIERILRALEQKGVRYVVAGGVAVNAYGYLRMTNDLDLALALDRDNVMEAFSALSPLGYRPAYPIRADEFADPAARREWVEKRNMQVLALISDIQRDAPIDLFAYEPFDVDAEYRATAPVELAPDLFVHLVRLETLIRMKERTGRPRDLDDVKHLKAFLDSSEGI